MPLPPDVLAERALRASRLAAKVRPVSDQIRTLSPEERKAVFLKLEHERPVPLVGTDLIPIGEPSEHFTLAIPRSTDLTKLLGRIDLFGASEVKKGHVPQERLAALTNVTFGQPSDRLSNTLLDQYDELTKRDWLNCEIECMSYARGTKQRRRELAAIRADITALFGQTRGNFFEHEEIGGTCRAVIRCTGEVFRTLVEEARWQTKVIWFAEQPRFETFSKTMRDFKFDALETPTAPPPDAPTICIIDSGVTPGNPFLTPVSRTDLFKSYLPDNPNAADEHGHGSGVASLAAYYSLNHAKGGSNTGRVWVASARVLDAENKNHDRLFSLVLEEVVRTFHPHGIRIFNLSVGIVNQPWNLETKRTVQRKSWVAREIDRISQKYDVVFVISAGNISSEEVTRFLEDGKPYPTYLTDETSRLLDPAQAALALTVGSIAPTSLTVGPAGKTSAVALGNQPSPFTRSGPGIHREIKPELVEFGGNYVIDDERTTVRQNPGTDVIMASHTLSPALRTDAGTSYAAPRVAYTLARILGDLGGIVDGPISASLLKAFCVNSATYRGDKEVKEFVDALGPADPKAWRYVLGYGRPEAARATGCDDHVVTLYFQGQIDQDSVAYFDIPVPAALAHKERGATALTVTVAHYPEVQRSGLERYLGATLKWRVFRGNVPRDEIIRVMSIESEEESKDQAVDLPNELRFDPGITLRSRGTVQHAYAEWNTHPAEHSESHYTLAIAAYRRWPQKKPTPLPYAVVIRLEDHGRSVSLYSEVESALIALRVRSQARS